MKMSTSSRLIIWAISSPNKQRWFRLNCKTWKLTEKKENSSRRVTDVLSRLNYIEFLRYSTTPYFGDWHNKSILFSLYGRVKQFWFLSQNQMFVTPYFSSAAVSKKYFCHQDVLPSTFVYVSKIYYISLSIWNANIKCYQKKTKRTIFLEHPAKFRA